MQAETTAPAAYRARYGASPGASEAQPSTTGYSFPPPPRTASAADDLKRDSNNASPAPREFQRPHTGHGNFSFGSAAAGPSSHSTDSEPRSMHLAGLAGLDAPYARPASTSGEMEYSTLGRAVANGGPVQNVMRTFEFSDYMGGPGGHDDPRQQHQHVHGSYYGQQPSQPYHAWRSHAAATPPPGHPFARGPAPPGPFLEWAKPRASQDDSAIGLNRQYGTPYAAMGPSGHHQVYTPYGFPHASSSSAGMARSISNQSGLSSVSAATAGTSGSDFDSHVNPSIFGYLSHDSGYHSSSGGEHHGYHPYGGYHLRSSNAGDVHGLGGLRIGGGPGPSSSYGMKTRRTTGRTRSSASKTPKVEDGEKKPPKKRVASTIFHPSPQSMLAPGATNPSAGALASSKGRGQASFPGTNSPALPTDDEFAQMPTKRSRGRRPPCTPDLDLDLEGDPNAAPTEAQIQYVGTTKTGKPRKVFLCKVPGCAKVFKRSEHLKRHVRSIHTNEKPFQCHWPTCGRYFSRHDNLNQHLRIHREPGTTDEEFSQQLREVFENRGGMHAIIGIKTERKPAAKRKQVKSFDEEDEEEEYVEEGEEEEDLILEEEQEMVEEKDVEVEEEDVKENTA